MSALVDSSTSPPGTPRSPEASAASDTATKTAATATGVVVSSVGKEEGQSCCVTPTAEECKIPKITACPAAPRKKCRLVIVPCRRRLQFEVEVIEVGSEEVGRLFRPRRVVPSVGRRRKRCCVDGNE